MIPGYFQDEGPFSRPYVDLTLRFPVANNQALRISFLVDTGADRTLLSPFVGTRLRERFGVDLLNLQFGSPIGGIGGQLETRTLDANLHMGEQSISTTLSLVEPPPGQFPTMPSLLGRDILYELALFMEYRKDRLLFSWTIPKPNTLALETNNSVRLRTSSEGQQRSPPDPARIWQGKRQVETVGRKSGQGRVAG